MAYQPKNSDPFQPLNLTSFGIKPQTTQISQSSNASNFAGLAQEMLFMQQNFVGGLAQRNQFGKGFGGEGPGSTNYSLDQIFNKLKNEVHDEDIFMENTNCSENDTLQFFKKNKLNDNFEQQISNIKARLTHRFQQNGLQEPSEFQSQLQICQANDFQSALLRSGVQSQLNQKSKATKNALLSSIKNQFKQSVSNSKFVAESSYLQMPAFRDSKLSFAQPIAQKLVADTLQNVPQIRASTNQITQAEKMIGRTLKGQSPVEVYDLSYLKQIKSFGITCPKLKLIKAFMGYLDSFTLYAENKLYSGQSNVGNMCNSLIQYEQNQSQSYENKNKICHEMFSCMWAQIKALGSVFINAKVNQNDLFNMMLSSTGINQQLGTQIAKISCSSLEEQFCFVNFGCHQVNKDMQLQRIQDFKNEAFKVVQSIQQVSMQEYEHICSVLISDNSQQTYPYVVVLLLLRAGLTEAIISYCSQHQMADLRRFGELFKKYHSIKMTPTDINQLRKIAQDELAQDMCKDALICLITGCVYTRKNEEHLLFKYILSANLDDQLWFFLKLASFQLQNSTVFDQNIIDSEGGYQTYSLNQLRHKITVEIGRENFFSHQFTDEVNAARYARVLLYLGDFNLSVRELADADFLVESMLFQEALKEIGLSQTRQDLIKILSTQSLKKTELMKIFSERQLVTIFNIGFDQDSCLITVANKVAQNGEFLTQGISLILLCSDQLLQQLALANYIIENKLVHLILETSHTFLDFQVNKQLTLRTVLGDIKFKAVAQKVAELLREEDPLIAITIYDKIKLHREVLNLMIDSLASRTRPAYFCSTELRGIPEAYLVTKRVTQEFETLIEAYKKDGLDKQHKDLFDVLTAFDTIATSFDLLAIEPISITHEIMTNSVQKLESLQIIPCQTRNSSIQTHIADFTNYDTRLQQIIPSVIICMSKLYWYINKSVAQQAFARAGMMSNSDYQKIDEKTKLQETLMAYAEGLTLQGGLYQQTIGEQLTKTFGILKEIQMEMLQ